MAVDVTPGDLTPGPIALVGSGEYLPVMLEVERHLIAGRPPRYVQIPTAAAPEGQAVLDRWTRLGAEQAHRLGVEAVPLMVHDARDADDAELAEQVRGAGMIYMSGGNPAHLAASLRGTALWREILAAWRAGAALAGCSAGAMAMTGWVPQVRALHRPVDPGLGLLPHLRVIPHFDKMLGWAPDLLTRVVLHAPEGVTVLGIDEDTAPGRRSTRVAGDGSAVRVDPRARSPGGAPGRLDGPHARRRHACGPAARGRAVGRPQARRPHARRRGVRGSSAVTVLLPPYILEGLTTDLVPDAVTWDSGDPDPEPGALGGVEVFVPPYTASAEDLGLMARMPALRVVQTLTAGVDNLMAQLPDGVVLCNASGVHDASTAELAVGLALASLRHIDEFARAMPEGSWLYDRHEALADKRVLVVGFGSIGRAIARRLAGFDVDLVAVARTAREVDAVQVHAMDDLPGLLPTADVVILIVPLTPRTRGMVDAQFLARMRSGALLVNVSRGQVVDTDALVAECRTGRLGAALDVTDPEPLPAEHPLWQIPGVLISPHVGGNTSAFLPRARRLVAAQLHRYAAGEQLANVVVGPGGSPRGEPRTTR